MGTRLEIDDLRGQTATGLERAYRETLAGFVALVNSEGGTLRAFNPRKPLRFSGLDRPAQTAILRRFGLYAEICAGLAGEGVSLREDRQLFWRAIQRFGLRPPSDMFSYVEDGDVFEIYEIDGFVQSFRSFEFYRWCSYSLDDLLCRPWWELYMRDQAVADMLYAKAKLAAETRPPALVFYEKGTHELDEIDSEERLHCVVESRFVAPLMDASGRVTALANVARAISVEARAGASRG